MCTCFFLFNRARDLFITARLHNHYFAKSVKKKHIMKEKTCVLKGIWSILFPYTHGGWKINEKVSSLVPRCCNWKVTWARFARSFWWLRNGNSYQQTDNVRNFPSLDDHNSRSHNHHLVHIADQFGDAVSTIIQSWGLALLFYMARFVHWEFSTWFWRGGGNPYVYVTLSFAIREVFLLEGTKGDDLV